MFFSFSTRKGANLRLSHLGVTSNFPSRMLFLPNGMSPVTNIHVIGLFKSIRTKNACYTSLFSLFLTPEPTLTKSESTVNSSINTMVFRNGYLKDERGDPQIFSPL